MERISARDLQQRVGQVIARLQRGERLLLTHRGSPIAVIAPLDQAAWEQSAQQEAERAEQLPRLAFSESPFAFWDNEDDAVVCAVTSQVPSLLSPWEVSLLVSDLEAERGDYDAVVSSAGVSAGASSATGAGSSTAAPSLLSGATAVDGGGGVAGPFTVGVLAGGGVVPPAAAPSSAPASAAPSAPRPPAEPAAESVSAADSTIAWAAAGGAMATPSTQGATTSPTGVSARTTFGRCRLTLLIPLVVPLVVGALGWGEGSANWTCRGHSEPCMVSFMIEPLALLSAPTAQIVAK